MVATSNPSGHSLLYHLPPFSLFSDPHIWSDIYDPENTVKYNVFFNHIFLLKKYKLMHKQKIYSENMNEKSKDFSMDITRLNVFLFVYLCTELNSMTTRIILVRSITLLLVVILLQSINVEDATQYIVHTITIYVLIQYYTSPKEPPSSHHT